MNLQEAKELAQQGVRMTHQDFTSDEWMIMKGNMIHFEDGMKIFFEEWVCGKPYLLNGWSRYESEEK
jgi:hypothetical protein